MWGRRISTVLFAALAGWLVATPGDVSAQASYEIEEAVRTTWADYSRAFADGRIDFIADSVYTTPSFHEMPGGMVLFTTKAELRELFSTALASARAQGYDHSETRASTVCPLTDGTAVLSVEYARYRTDGGVLSEGAGTYLFTNTTDGWRIVGQIGHPSDRLLDCHD